VIEKIYKDVASIFADSGFQERHLKALAFTAVASTPADFERFIAEDLAYKGRLIQATGIKAE
jgi:tripartite-type tricarboxylate transporter receptor subunit TctC